MGSGAWANLHGLSVWESSAACRFQHECGKGSGLFHILLAGFGFGEEVEQAAPFAPYLRTAELEVAA